MQKDRISFRERMLQRNIDFKFEINKINDIISGQYIYDLRGAYISSPFTTLESTFDKAVSYILRKKDFVDIDVFRDYVEFLYTIFDSSLVCKYHEKTRRLKLIIEEDLRILNLGIYMDDNSETYCTFLKNGPAEIVASNVDENVSDKIYKYLSLRDGELENKRMIIKSLCDDTETFIKLNSDKYLNKVKEFYQCARHTKDNRIKSFPFYYEDEEKWLDYIFVLIIDVLAYKDLSVKCKEIVKFQSCDA